MHYPSYGTEILTSKGHGVEGESEIFLNLFANLSIKDFLRAVVSVLGKIKNYFSVLEQL